MMREEGGEGVLGAVVWFCLSPHRSNPMSKFDDHISHPHSRPNVISQEVMYTDLISSKLFERVGVSSNGAWLWVVCQNANFPPRRNDEDR